MLATTNMRLHLKNAFEYKNTTEEEFRKESDSFRSAVRKYNYNLFLFKERVAYKCDEIALELQAKFREHIEKYQKAHDELD